jgi:Uma2 family endonuclease
MTYAPQKLLTIAEFMREFGDRAGFELADGEVINMEPTGPHEIVGGKLASCVGLAIAAARLPWAIPRTCLIQPFAEVPTARRPDVVVLDETRLGQEPLWQREPIITLGESVKLVIEVVSTNWETDYARKVEEYSLLGIPEYWICDYLGLGGIAFIGRPKQPTFTVCQLQGDEYLQTRYRLGDRIVSPLLPNLNLRLDDVMPR